MPGDDAPECRARLWLVRAPSVPQPHHFALLDARERTACDRLASPTLQARYACAHALLRTVLAPLLGQSPEAIEILPGEKRRPGLQGASRARRPQLDFNLSGSGPWIACALGRGLRVGVDLEVGEGRLDIDGLAARLFDAQEQRWLARATNPHAAFCRLWALKEAVSKAHGEGVGLDFARLHTLPGPASEGALSIDLAALNCPGAWRLLSLQGPGDPDSALALALWGEDVRGHIDLAPPCPEGFTAHPVRQLATGSWAP